MRSTVLSLILGLSAALAWHSDAGAVCRPASAAALEGDLLVQAQVLAAPEAAQPYVVVRCFLRGAIPDRVWIPISSADAVAQVITVDAWDRLWNATAPRAVVREPPSAAVGELPRHDLDPPVAAVLSHPKGPVLAADVALVEVDAAADLPEAARAIVTVVFSGDLPEEGGWTPWIRLPMATTDDGRALLPVLPEAELRGETAAAHIETTVLLLGVDTYWALAGFDVWDATDREPGSLARSAEVVSPNPVLVIPDLRVHFNRSRAGGFNGFYGRRVDEVAPDPSFPLAVLQYAGGLGRRDGLLPQPEPLEWYTDAKRLVRVRLDGLEGHPLPVVATPPALYLPIWVTRPLAEAAAPADPSELELSGDMAMFGFGAEHLGEMNATQVRRTIEDNSERLMACDPGGSEVVPVDIQLMVEPGGTTIAVFVDVEPWSVGQCLIDTFTDTLFPMATGSSVAVRFPIAYQVR